MFLNFLSLFEDITAVYTISSGFITAWTLLKLSIESTPSTNLPPLLILTGLAPKATLGSREHRALVMVVPIPATPFVCLAAPLTSSPPVFIIFPL